MRPPPETKSPAARASGQALGEVTGANLDCNTITPLRETSQAETIAQRRAGAPALTAERARELLHYNPETGALTWRVPRGCQRGALAGTRTSEGYTQVEIDYRLYRAHRVIWLMQTGKWPKQLLDHRNGMRADNRWRNLREATPLQNARNRRPGKSNSSGTVGVSYLTSLQRWEAYIGLDNRCVSLGRFVEKDEAISARRQAEQHHYGEFAAGGGLPE
ncbi:HNH endonuclease signature motif containing protein [Mesorhizobium amorphae]|uniref:HNH endonuclease signature motif containing protein n=1 Tax=Mesorhizobium amorphae TaxID=71433 RepID=UPI0024A71486|nr:HNH endonuclease signature motif containing protein [Mesorhizobium amorphae]